MRRQRHAQQRLREFKIAITGSGPFEEFKQEGHVSSRFLAVNLEDLRTGKRAGGGEGGGGSEARGGSASDAWNERCKWRTGSFSAHCEETPSHAHAQLRTPAWLLLRCLAARGEGP
jgi:hypothetical protein